MSSLLVSVGEASGDRQAAAVVAALKGTHRVLGKAGDHLCGAGVESVIGLEGHFGFSRPFAMLSELRQSRRALLDAALKADVKRALLVDYSGFHIPLGRALRRHGVHVVGFIPPKLWAWGGWRLKKARQAYDELFTILPFEADWWTERGVPASYCGNPIADETPAVPAQPGGPVALIPGSRSSELQHVGPLLAATARVMLGTAPDLQFVVPVAPTLERTALRSTFDGLPVTLVDTMAEAVGGASVALVCNGTAGLEVALVGTPHVLTYRTGALHWAIGNALVQLDVASPNNLVLTRAGFDQAWPERFQGAATPEGLAAEALALRGDAQACAAQHAASAQLRSLMRGGVGIEAVAQAWAGP